MVKRRSIRFARVLRLSALVAITAGSAIPAAAAPSSFPKPYRAIISPDTVPAGATVTFTLSLENLADQQQIGSANLTPPAGFVLTGVVSPGAPVATIAGNVLQLRNLALQPGQTFLATFTGVVPCSGGAASWTPVVKQNNNFNGPPGNDLVLAEGSDLDTPVTGSCALRFVAGRQPSDAEVDATIASAPFDPSGDGAQVEVIDGDGNRTASTASITAQIDPSSPNAPPEADLSGQTTRPAAAGVATFSDLSIDTHGTFVLLATSPGLTSASSQAFTIWDEVTACTQDQACTGTVNRAGSMSASIQAMSTTSGFLLVNVGADALDCGDSFNHAPSVVTIDVLGLTTTGGKSATIVIDKAVVNQTPNNGVTFYQACYGSETPFTTRDGTIATLGLLPDCATQSPVPPCVRSKNKTGRGDVVIVVDMPDGDPKVF